MEETSFAWLAVLAALVVVGVRWWMWTRSTGPDAYVAASYRRISRMSAEAFLREVENEKRPFRFTREDILASTRHFSTRLGAGRSGTVFQGALPNSLAVAVKVLHRGAAAAGSALAEEQFVAEVAAIGRASRHANLVRLLGFCSDDGRRALVYEHMEHGALDAFLLGRGRDAGLPALRDIAAGVARGIQHLHEECDPKAVHYDIKPGNVLLDGELTPKVADLGVARLVNRADAHVTVSVAPAKPGPVAPELRVHPDITEKCDVYGFGMLLLEIVGRRRRNVDAAASEPDNSLSQQWFPELAWTKYESGDLTELFATPAIRDHDESIADDDLRQRTEETVERMCKVAFWCVQQRPEARPAMGVVVKMLEGEMDVPPPANPFLNTMAVPVVVNLRTTATGSGNTGMTAAAANGGPDGGNVIESICDIAQTVINLQSS